MEDHRQIQAIEGLYHTLDVINEAEAEKTYKDAAYYKKIGKVASAEYLLRKAPQALAQQPLGREGQNRARRARQAPANTLQAQPRSSSRPAGPIHVGGGMGGMGGGMGGMGGMGMGGMGMGGMPMGGMG